MTRREMTIYALLGFGVWLSGAIMFRLGGRLIFENGPIIVLACGAGIAVSVCLLLNATMGWRRAPPSQAILVAVIMALPGLFGDVAYVAAFSPITGLSPTSAGPYAAIVIFGNAALLAFAVVRAWPAIIRSAA